LQTVLCCCEIRHVGPEVLAFHQLSFDERCSHRIRVESSSEAVALEHFVHFVRISRQPGFFFFLQVFPCAGAVQGLEVGLKPPRDDNRRCLATHSLWWVRTILETSKKLCAPSKLQQRDEPRSEVLALSIGPCCRLIEYLPTGSCKPKKSTPCQF